MVTSRANLNTLIRNHFLHPSFSTRRVTAHILVRYIFRTATDRWYGGNFSELLVLYWTCLSLHKKHIVCFCHHWIGTWQMLASILIPAVSIGFPVTYTVNETLVFKLMLLQLVQFVYFQYYYNCVSCMWHP